MEQPGLVTGRERDFSVLVRSDDDLSEAGEQALAGLVLDVERRGGEEENGGEEHQNHGHSETQSPSVAVLDVDYGGESDYDGDRCRSVVPIEEPLQDPLVPRVVSSVDLVGSEGKRARPYSAGSDRHEHEGESQDRHLRAFRRRALLSEDVTPRWP